MIGVILLAVLCQQPLSGSVVGFDLIQLKVGNEFVGRITNETADFIEIILSEGITLGFRKSRVSAIIRAASATRGLPNRPPDDIIYRRRDDWRVLHDGSGQGVGWLHETITRGENGEFRIGEEWQFADDHGITALTILEVLDAEQRPISCFYRERTTVRGQQQVSSERIVQAIIKDGRIEISRHSTHGRSKTSYELPEACRFPLELREELRHRPAGNRLESDFVIFDPREEQLVRRSFKSGETRRVEHDQELITVRVLRSQTSAGENQEWLDGLGNSLRREVNGPALVALPSTERLARHHADKRREHFPAALMLVANKSFGMWLPNPTWEFAEIQPEDRIIAVAPLLEATVTLMQVAQLETGLELDFAADAVMRWFRLLYPKLGEMKRSKIRLRGVPGIKLSGAYREKLPGKRSRSYLCELVVLKSLGQTYALSFHGPSEHRDIFKVDMQSIMSRIELHRQSLDPVLAGPLKAKNRR